MIMASLNEAEIRVDERWRSLATPAFWRNINECFPFRFMALIKVRQKRVDLIKKLPSDSQAACCDAKYDFAKADACSLCFPPAPRPPANSASVRRCGFSRAAFQHRPSFPTNF
jgi:hypothetical protein